MCTPAVLIIIIIVILGILEILGILGVLRILGNLRILRIQKCTGSISAAGDTQVTARDFRFEKCKKAGKKKILRSRLGI